MKRRGLIFLFIAVLTSADSTALVIKACPSQVLVKSGEANTITVDSARPIRRLAPEFFGFNLEWVEFQESLWDRPSGKVRTEVADWLRAFPGAVYRYPGGTIANSMDWRDTVGVPGERPSRQFVSWTGPFPARFGLDEYLNFVREVNGQAWYVVNIFGGSSGETSPHTLATQAGQLSEYLAKKRQDGLPGILRWELGNELDRGEYRWPPEKLAETAKLAADEIQRGDPQAKFVSLMQEYPAQGDIGIPASQYNLRLARGLQAQVSEYAMHVYYDGLPGGQPVPSRVRAICEAVADARNVAPKRTPTIWLTEHASVPPNAWADPNWKASWPRTGDLGAAMGVADMVIAAAQIPEVRGTFVHALHGTDGPWPLFHKEKGGSVHPGAVYWALRILRGSMLEDVLPTTTSSPNNSHYDGGYDLRTVVMADAERKRYAVWAVNRSGQPLASRLNIAAVKNMKLAGKHVWLADSNPRANNYLAGSRLQPTEHPFELTFDQAGSTTVTLPPYSVSAFSFSSNE
jgi:alpha-L-arabinofuranosidase